MMRRVAVVGDKLDAGGEILSYKGLVFTVGPANKQVALIGGEAYCEACKTTGHIAKSGGPRRLNFMGETAADQDIVLCQCPEPPRIVARLAGEAWCDDMAEVAGYCGIRADRIGRYSLDFGSWFRRASPRAGAGCLTRLSLLHRDIGRSGPIRAARGWWSTAARADGDGRRLLRLLGRRSACETTGRLNDAEQKDDGAHQFDT